MTDDGTETDLDLGHYERFIDESLTRGANVTTGKIYWSVLQKERRGDYGGHTVQVIPHITDEIKSHFYRDYKEDETTIAIIEVGGTVGDIESQPFLEAIRQFQREVGFDNAILMLVSLVPYLRCSQELKTKPTQNAVKTLQGMGLQPDILICRSEHEISRSVREKIGLFCNVPAEHVLQNLDLDTLYAAPLMLEEEHLADVVCGCLSLPCPAPKLTEWKEMVDVLRQVDGEHPVRIAIVGKYTALHDAYISVVEALKHGGIAHHTAVEIVWVDSETVDKENVPEIFSCVDGILVPGGFGDRGIEGMVDAIRYAREQRIPYLGICLGMQLAIVEIARDLLQLTRAGSVEIDPDTPYPVIHLMPDQNGVEDIGGTLRLGSWPCILKEGTIARRLYGSNHIDERHRHRYEVNNDYRVKLTGAGVVLSGLSPDGRIVEMMELPEEVHPFFVGTQAHPEFKSRPNRPHPLFVGLIGAALRRRESISEDR